MDANKVIQQHKSLCKLISEKKIKQSLDILQNIISASSFPDLRDEFDNMVLTYKSMLKYTMEGITDPERNKIYLKLMQSILGLSDRLRQDILSHYSGWHTYWVKQQTEREQDLTGKRIPETLNDLVFKPELDEILKILILNQGFPKCVNNF
jgi:hypothetical protein